MRNARSERRTPARKNKGANLLPTAMPRASEEEDAGLTSASEARALAGEIRERATRLASTPGLLDGALNELTTSLERVLREYDKMSRGRLGPFERDLDAIAKRAQDLEKAGRLTARHAKLIDRALQHTRRVHFWNAHRVLQKFDIVLQPWRKLQSDLDAYRAFHKKAVFRVRDAEAAVTRLQAVPNPPAGPDEVSRAKVVVEGANLAADRAWESQTHRALAEALKDLIVHPDVDGLGLLSTQEFACLRDLSDLLEEDADLRLGIGTRPLAELVATSEFSAAKWDRVFPSAVHARRKLQDLFHHLRPVVSGTHGAAFSLDLSASTLERRVAAWRRFPGAESSPAWDEIGEFLTSGRVPTVQEAAHAYERHGDLARRAWRGEIAKEIEEQEKELAAARKALDKLPAPDGLL